ncbi:MAG TPA: Smr/MutS family protein [Caulobacteraceae bacterium]|nr:Smr/MutS family protein [Caulobacteraceae bacterium]
MKGPPHEDLRLWSVVAATVRPLPGRAHPAKATSAKTAKAAPAASTAPRPPLAVTPAPRPHHPPLRRAEAPPEAIEPGRRRRLTRGHEALAAVIDLHNMTQDQARSALTGFIRRAREDGERAVLVITGKGALGDGVLRRRVPDWLAEPPLREAVAGVSEAHRRHGGEGALYVALRR